MRLFEQSWELGIRSDRPTRALEYYVNGNMVGPELMCEMIEVRRGWTEAELLAGGASPGDLPRLTWGFVNLALQMGELELAREWAERGYELAQESGNPSAIAGALLSVGMSRLTYDPDGALRAFEACLDLFRQGAFAAGAASALFQGALVYARRGERGRASSLLVESIENLRPGGRTAELDGACGYAIEILLVFGLNEAALVVLGAVFDGELRVLRNTPVPPDRQPADARALREIVGRERFAELLAVGARMSYDEVLDHIIASVQSSAQ
jgi:hypothetical protein